MAFGVVSFDAWDHGPTRGLCKTDKPDLRSQTDEAKENKHKQRIRDEVKYGMSVSHKYTKTLQDITEEEDRLFLAEMCEKFGEPMSSGEGVM